MNNSRSSISGGVGGEDLLIRSLRLTLPFRRVSKID